MANGEVYFAGIEAGGTSFVVAVAKDIPTNIISRQSFPTKQNPEETFELCANWFQSQNLSFSSLGIASFGPVELDRNSSQYGFITTTPKPGWTNANIVGYFKSRFPSIPIGFDTDVNAAAAGHLRHAPPPPPPPPPHSSSNSQKISSCAYITVGTGIGVGIVIDGRPVHGLLHPEMGHIYVPRAKGDELFEGTCPFHGACIEGLSNAASLAKRKGISPSELASLPDSDPIWTEVFPFYLAVLCSTLALTVSPQVIVIGGGVLQRQSVFPSIRRQFLELTNGYLKSNQLSSLETLESYIIPSPFLNNAGIVGAFELAREALENSQRH